MAPVSQELEPPAIPGRFIQFIHPAFPKLRASPPTGSKFLAAVTLLVALSIPASGQDLALQIVGVWKFLKQRGGDRQGYQSIRRKADRVVYTKGGRLIFSVVGDNRKPAGPGSATGTP
jgi:hypothetical protein